MSKSSDIPMCYGGIDRIYGHISIESADKILDLIDDYVDLVEMCESAKENESQSNCT